MSSTGVVQLLRHIDRQWCCVTIEQRTSPMIAVSVERSRRMLISALSWQSSVRYVGALPDIDTGRPGQRPWIELVVARAASAVAAESAWCDHGAAHLIQIARRRSGRIVACDIGVLIVFTISSFEFHQVKLPWLYCDAVRGRGIQIWVTDDPHSQAVKGSRDLLLEFWDPFHISGTVQARNFKFGTPCKIPYIHDDQQTKSELEVYGERPFSLIGRSKPFLWPPSGKIDMTS